MGLGFFYVGGGGNCQFRAFSHQMFGRPDHHILVRQEAIKYIQSNRERFLSLCFLSMMYEKNVLCRYEPFMTVKYELYITNMARSDGSLNSGGSFDS